MNDVGREGKMLGKFKMCC